MLITLEKWKKQQNQFPIEITPFDEMVLSAIGARICYSNEHPLDMINDKRILDPVERTKFLQRLSKSGHFSVFAHSPVFFTLSPNYAGLNSYKLWRYNTPETVYFCATARHFVEDYFTNDEERNRYIEVACQRVILSCQFKWIWLDKEWRPTIANHISELINAEIDRGKGVLGIICQQEPWHWYSFISHGFSVIYSHQHVRHTWQNFNQRSHRYTRVDDIVEPPTIRNASEDVRQVFESVVHTTSEIYNYMIQEGIPKEDARFIVPSGRATTLMFSGPHFVMEDFIQKRKIKAAQWEIREVALMCERILQIAESFK